MTAKVITGEEVVHAYWNMFVNRLAYTVQSRSPHAETGRHYYFRPTKKGQPVSLSFETVQQHLEGKLTIGLYAINPKTQRCRWVRAIA